MNKLNELLHNIMKEAEDNLKEQGTYYDAVLNNEDSEEYGTDAENNNFDAGRISVCIEVLNKLCERCD